MCVWVSTIVAPQRGVCVCVCVPKTNKYTRLGDERNVDVAETYFHRL